MYSTVPNHSPPVSAEAWPTSNSSASPKSSTTTRPSAVTRTLEGLRSQCSRPARCSVRSALASWRVADVMRVNSPIGASGLRSAGANGEGGAGDQSRLGAVDLAVGPCRHAPRRFVGAHECQKVDPVHQLHREEPPIVGGEELVERGQVRIRKVGQQAELALEAIECARLDLGQRLERDLHVAHAVQGLVDDAHAAGAQPALNQESPGLSQRRARFWIHAREVRRRRAQPAAPGAEAGLSGRERMLCGRWRRAADRWGRRLCRRCCSPR